MIQGVAIRSDQTTTNVAVGRLVGRSGHGFRPPMTVDWHRSRRPMNANPAGDVEMSTKVDGGSQRSCPSSFVVRLFGPLTILRDDVPLALPASRKVRALFAYLALAPQAVTRSKLCELLWDIPNDPRGELRWCLSKIRGLIDDADRRKVDTRADSIRLDLSDCFVDGAVS
jgi:hypothetical protein